MSLAITYSRANCGIHAHLVTVEAHISGGLPRISIVGLPETAVKESKDRVRSALLNMKFNFPPSRLTINLAPADLPKDGARFDLAMALSILAATAQIPMTTLEDYEFIGELALSGQLRQVKGILPVALACKNRGKKLILPWQNAAEASLVSDLDILPSKHFLDVCAHLTGATPLSSFQNNSRVDSPIHRLDLADIQGQQQAKRALEIAAAGNHSLLLVGPPGTGKTMLASRLPGLLPAMSEKEALETAAIRSVSHNDFNSHSWARRPFRSPHHSASAAALIGGGSLPRPGEISLAHNGVLFLDELPEFSRSVLETLRAPLESGKVIISRASQQAEFPAKFQLIAAMNPCPCGYLNDPEHNCRCTPEQISRYHHKVSGPMLDRIDMHVQMTRIPINLLTSSQPPCETTDIVRQHVVDAQKIQLQRANKTNAQLTSSELKKYCQLKSEQQQLLTSAAKKLKLSARAYHRVLKVARTIADIHGKKDLSSEHISEALSYRVRQY
ncbi:MAG: YifB family Mg chelatase-like AAA ATPase [Pseudomonadota bacterium]